MLKPAKKSQDALLMPWRAAEKSIVAQVAAKGERSARPSAPPPAAAGAQQTGANTRFMRNRYQDTWNLDQ